MVLLVKSDILAQVDSIEVEIILLDYIEYNLTQVAHQLKSPFYCFVLFFC